MASVKLIIEDLEDGHLRMRLESDPPLPEGLRDDEIDEKLTPAQKLALFAYAEVYEVIQRGGGKEHTLGAAAN